MKKMSPRWGYAKYHRMVRYKDIAPKGALKSEAGIRSFSYALKGLAFFFRSELNARIHTAIALLVVVMGIVLGISRIEWITIILCICIVFVTEIMNTSIERLVDIVSPQISEKAGMVKDIAAGSVLVSAVLSVIAGLLIFIPYLK